MTFIALFMSIGIGFATGCTHDEASVELENVKIPLHAQTTTMRKWVEPLMHETGAVGRDSAVTLYRPGLVKATAEGSFYLVDFADMSIKRYDQTGWFERSYGNGRGTGPGEFDNAPDLAISDAGDILLTDPNRRTILRFA